MELFYFIPFGTKWLQTAPGAGGEAVPNGADMMAYRTMATGGRGPLMDRGCSGTIGCVGKLRLHLDINIRGVWNCLTNSTVEQLHKKLEFMEYVFRLLSHLPLFFLKQNA
jgi:hypothetical protein